MPHTRNHTAACARTRPHEEEDQDREAVQVQVFSFRLFMHCSTINFRCLTSLLEISLSLARVSASCL